MLLPTHDAWIVSLSVLIAILASYVALDLARRVRACDRSSAHVWIFGAAVMLGSGIWAMHFVGMLAFELPIPIGYAAGNTFLSWMAAVIVSAIALQVAALDRPRISTLCVGALVMAGGICAMHYAGMAAMDMTPEIVWNHWLVATSVFVAFGGAVTALLMVFWHRGRHRAYCGLRRLAAAAVMGIAISAMHYIGVAAASFPGGSVCRSVDGLGRDDLGSLILLITVLLLASTLFTSTLDARLKGKALRLARSLKSANTELHHANVELERIAFRDPLTGIPNRMLLADRLEQATARIDRLRASPNVDGPARLGLLFIDLDGFKPVNDVEGHAAGDDLLRQVAVRLHSLVRKTDTVARIGGDEFVLLLTDLKPEADAVVMAERVLRSLSKSFRLPEREVKLGCSIGVAIYPDHGEKDRVMAAADAAMYQAKRAGGGTYAIFERQMLKGAAELFDLQQDLRAAVDLGQMQLHYQPIVDARSGRVCGVEALARWMHPTRGVIDPGVFIPIAERFGLIVQIGNWVIDEACRQLARWSREKPLLRVSVNLSRHQLGQVDLVQHIARSIRDNQIEAEQLVLEITESAAMEDGHVTHLAMEKFSQLGVKLSIDDFGTGYSSLATLRQLQIDEIKIDRSFVTDVPTCRDARAIVDAIVRLAHALELRVVAEGVETAQQRDVLVTLGCDQLQGYHFAHPMSVTSLTESVHWTTDELGGADVFASTFDR